MSTANVQRSGHDDVRRRNLYPVEVTTPDDLPTTWHEEPLDDALRCRFTGIALVIRAA